MTRVVVISLAQIWYAYMLAHELVRASVGGRGGAILLVTENAPNTPLVAGHLELVLLGLFQVHPTQVGRSIEAVREAGKVRACVLVVPADLPTLLPQLGRIGQTLALHLPDRHAAEAQAVALGPLLEGEGEHAMLIVDAPAPEAD